MRKYRIVILAKVLSSSCKDTDNTNAPRAADEDLFLVSGHYVGIVRS